MWWYNKRLGGSVLILKTISVPSFGRDYWHGGRADNSNETANNAKYSSCKGLNHETYDISLQNLQSPPFWILSHFECNFYPFSVYLQAKHDSFCARGTPWCRFLDNTLTLRSFYVTILKKNFDTGKQTLSFYLSSAYTLTLRSFYVTILKKKLRHR